MALRYRGAARWFAAAASVWLLAACGSAAPSPAPQSSGAKPAASSGTSQAAPSSAASTAPAGGASTKGSTSASLTPFKVAIAARAALYLPLEVAQAAGYFKKHGLDVHISVLSAAVSAAAVESGSVNMYFGGATPVAADLKGAHLIYIAAGVDRSTLALIGQKGITTFPQLRGKSVSTTSPGAFGDVALHATAPKYGMVAGRDFHIVYNRQPGPAYAELISGRVAAMINTAPHSTEAEAAGYPVIIDYYKQGFKIIGPGMAVRRSYFQSHQKVLTDFIEGYLDGVRRVFDDKAYSMHTDQQDNNVQKSSLLQSDYALNLKVINKNLTVDPASIQVILNTSSEPAAKGFDVHQLYDNALIQQINRTYAKRLFPHTFGAA